MINFDHLSDLFLEIWNLSVRLDLSLVFCTLIGTITFIFPGIFHQNPFCRSTYQHVFPSLPPKSLAQPNQHLFPILINPASIKESHY